MITLKDELNGLKADFLSLQNFLKDKITSIEFKINDIENKMCIEYYTKNETASNSTSVQELDNQTRNIIEELMWESTLSQSALRVREIFKDSNAREKFLRCCLELVLEKDEQYRKMAGTLFGHLINQNIINQTNVFNSLSSVLLVIENSNNYNTKMWRNLTEILLPMIMDSHIKLLQVQRRAQTILKQDYYREFIDHLCCAVESSRKHKFKPKSVEALTPLAQSATFTAPAATGGAVAAEKRDFNVELQDECAAELQNLYDVESISKFKPCFDNMPLDEPPHPKYDVERLLNMLAPNNVDDAVKQLTQLDMAELKSVLEDIVDQGVHKEPEQRLLIGSVLAGAIAANLFDAKQVVGTFCKCIFKVQRLVVNQNTRVPTCAAFIDMLLPMFAERHLKFGQLSAVAAAALPEETKTIFLWFMEKALNEKGLSEATSTMQPSAVTAKLMKRMRKFMGKSAAQRTDDGHEDIGDAPTISESKAVAAATAAAMAPQRRISPIRSDRREKVKPYAAQAPAQQSSLAPPPMKFDSDANNEEQSEHEKFLNLKRKKLLKERIENAGDKVDIKIDDLLNDPSKKLLDGDLGGDPQQRLEGQKVEVEQVPIKQPENLPSSAIKEKMHEIIERLMEAGNMDECVTTVKETFNECQTDLVFKAAFEYTKDKSSEYRVQSGRLVSEAFKHDPRRIGAQIMNTISLELGDFVDVPELWNGMAEIICPPMLNGLIRFVDLKLLPKYFLHTNHCASLLLAIFKQIIQQSNVEWLQENWKKSKLELSTFLPLNTIYEFITDNKLEFLVKDEQLSQYKENAS